MTAPGLRGSESPLVGGGRELARVRDHLVAARDGSPRLVLLEGEPGIGKTRILRSAQLSAVTEGFTVLSGRCMEHLELPYLPFQTALLPRLAEVARAEPSLHGVAGVIGEALDPADAPPDLAERGTAHGRARFLHAAARATITLCAGGPVLVSVDDLQWADRSSVDLLTQLVLEAVDAALGRRVPLLFLATLRPPPEGRIARDLARLGREEACHRLEVGPLDEDGVAELLRASGVGRPPRQLTAAVLSSTGGNPLLVSTVRQLLVGRVRGDGGQSVVVGSLEGLALPDDLSDAVGRRIDELAPSSREVLAAAAVTGDPFTASTVAEVAGVTVETSAQALSEAAAMGLVTIERSSVSFAHPLFAHQLRSATPAARRQELHLAAARAVAVSAVADSGADRIIRVGLHLAAAGSAAEPREVVDGCRAAGERAWQQAAWGEAAELFDSAADAARRIDPHAVELAELLARAGAAHLRNLDPGPGRARLEEAVARFEDHGDLLEAVRCLMELTHVDVTWGSYGRPVDVERLESLLPDVEARDPELCARGHAQLAEASWAQGHVSGRTRHVDRALDLAERHGFTAVRSRAYLALAQTRWLRLDLDGAHDALVLALDAGRRSGNGWLAGLPLSRLALTLFWQGRLAEARAAADDARAYTDELANFAEKSFALAVLTCLALARGDFTDAERRGEEAVSAIRISRYTWTFVARVPRPGDDASAPARHPRRAFGTRPLGRYHGDLRRPRF